MKKTKIELNQLVFRRTIEAILFLIFTGLLLNFTVKNYPVPQYVLSGLALGVFALVGFFGSAREILLISRLDYSKPVTSFQVQLEKLKAYSLQTLRLIFLSVPFYFAYIIIGFKVLFNVDIYANGNTNWIIANLIFSILLIPFSIWLYSKLSYKTKSKLGRKLIEGKQINAALQFLNEIETFKNE